MHEKQVALVTALASAEPSPGGQVETVYQTYDTDETNDVNSEIGTNWYVRTPSPSDSTWANELHGDINSNFVPPIMLVKTNYLPGWGTIQANHFVTIFQNDYVDNELVYWDTATSFASGRSDTLGPHLITRSQVDSNNGLLTSIW